MNRLSIFIDIVIIILGIHHLLTDQHSFYILIDILVILMGVYFLNKDTKEQDI